MNSAIPPVILTTAYLAPVAYYACLYAAPFVIEERADHFLKQTYRNRAVIAAPDGPQTLTIPILRPGQARSKTPTRDIEISPHGRWQHLHWAALRTAYEASPYFDYLADEFRQIYERPCRFLVDFNEALQAVVLDALGLTPDVRPTAQYVDPAAHPDWLDLRETLQPKHAQLESFGFTPRPYYQVFASRHGFLPNLSIVDLLFNLGPESRLVLRDSLDVTKTYR